MKATRRTSMKFERKKQPVADRFWAKVNKDGPVPDFAPELGPCWIWTGYVSKQLGYGQFRVNGVTTYTHRWAYEKAGGAIPKGWHTDHLCRVGECCNPAHLEAVTPSVNTRRGEGPCAEHAAKSECAKGHPFTPENTIITKGIYRRCRTCDRAWQAARRQRKRAAKTG